MLRAGKALGGGSSVMPYSANSVEDLTWDFASAVSHGLIIISWQENLPSDEMPPRWMWAFDDELEQWFEEVKRKRDEKYGTNSSGHETGQAKKGSYDGPGFMQNELAAGIKG